MSTAGITLAGLTAICLVGCATPKVALDQANNGVVRGKFALKTGRQGNAIVGLI